MPELPEVETVRLGLLPYFTGKRVRRVESMRPDLRFPLPERFSERLAGQAVASLERRAKYLLAHLEGGESLIMHLGMTGRFTVARGPSRRGLANFVYGENSDPRHDHVIFDMLDGTRIVYNDPRRFGYMLLVETRALAQHPLIRGLGPEPLGTQFTSAGLSRQALGRKVNLKAFLMDQRVVAGLGNIYVSEALYRARLSPLRPARTLQDGKGRPNERCECLVTAIRNVLADAIAAGGSTLRDYRHADGTRGAFQEKFFVYDRAGEACHTPKCAGKVHRVVQVGRATFYCPKCQR